MSEHDLSLQEIAKAVEGINTAWEEQKQTMGELEAQVKKMGAEAPETKAKFDKIEAEIQRVGKVTEEAALAAKRRERRQLDADGREIDFEAKARKWGASAARAFGASGAIEYDADRMAQYKRIQLEYFRKGVSSFGPDEIKALSVGGDPDGGYVVNPDMSGRVVDRMFDTSPVRAYASVTTIGTSELEGLYDDDELDAGWVDETAPRTDTSTPQLGKWSIPVNEMYAMPTATQKFLDDAEINVENWLANKVGDKFARTEAAAFVSGNGVSKPRGFLTYGGWATAGVYQRGALERVKTGVNGGFAAAPNGGDALINVITNLQSRYTGNAYFYMNRFTQGAVRKLKDSDGAYLWSPGIAAGQPASLLGQPIAIFEDMPNIATGSLSIAFGDLRACYTIVDRAGIRTLRDPYTSKPYIKFYSTKRVGGNVLDFAALKLVEFSA